jgi:NAD(P)H-dependent FMN reductase
MKTPVTFLGIAGSLRRLSFNRGLIRATVELAPDGITVIPTTFLLPRLETPSKPGTAVGGTPATG